MDCLPTPSTAVGVGPYFRGRPDPTSDRRYGSASRNRNRLSRRSLRKSRAVRARDVVDRERAGSEGA